MYLHVISDILIISVTYSYLLTYNAPHDKQWCLMLLSFQSLSFSFCLTIFSVSFLGPGSYIIMIYTPFRLYIITHQRPTSCHKYLVIIYFAHDNNMFMCITKLFKSNCNSKQCNIHYTATILLLPVNHPLVAAIYATSHDKYATKWCNKQTCLN